jgi:hypothetical protein
LRDVEDDPVGIGKREGVQVDLAAEIHDETHLRLVAAEARVSRNWKRIGERRRTWPVLRGSGRSEEDTKKHAAQRPRSHRFSPPIAFLILH